MGSFDVRMVGASGFPSTMPSELSASGLDSSLYAEVVGKLNAEITEFYKTQMSGGALLGMICCCGGKAIQARTELLEKITGIVKNDGRLHSSELNVDLLQGSEAAAIQANQVQANEVKDQFVYLKVTWGAGAGPTQMGMAAGSAM